jgi:hypothetical protein
MSYDPDEQAKADKHIARWSRGKRDFETVRARMGQICKTEMDLLNSGQQGLGVIRNGKFDLDHAYRLAKMTHPETLAEIRKAERREKAYTPPAERRDPSENVRETILRSMRENAENG